MIVCLYFNLCNAKFWGEEHRIGNLPRVLKWRRHKQCSRNTAMCSLEHSCPLAPYRAVFEPSLRFSVGKSEGIATSVLCTDPECCRLDAVPDRGGSSHLLLQGVSNVNVSSAVLSSTGSSLVSCATQLTAHGFRGGFPMVAYWEGGLSWYSPTCWVICSCCASTQGASVRCC